MLIALLGAHFYLDYAGQGDFMAKAKNVYSPLPGVPAWTVLWSHGAIHGAAASLITGLWWIFVLETLIHTLTDAWKCCNKLTFREDQAIHVASKVLWFGIAMGFGNA